MLNRSATPPQMRDIRVRPRSGRSMGGPRKTEFNLKWPSFRLQHVLMLALILIGFLGVLALREAGRWIGKRPMFEIHQVRVVGDLDQVDRDLVKKRALALKASFFNLDLALANSELRTVPWVRGVTVHRVWPDQLELTIEEQKPLARWSDSELINTRGEKFSAEYSGVLPYFKGPQGSEALMRDQYQRMMKKLSQIPLAITDLELTERGAWRLTADNGLEIELGRDDMEARLNRFVEIYPQLLQTTALSGAVADLRYNNGFALRPAGAPKDSKS